MTNAFRCDYCGQFIAYDDIGTDRAECYMLTPDSEFSTETFATHHMDCKQADEMPARQGLGSTRKRGASVLARQSEK